MSADLVTLEEMPGHLRESHRAARNWGVYPANGATRRLVPRDEAEEIVADDPDGYASIVEVATRRGPAEPGKRNDMAQYKITSSAGVELGVYEAASPEAALDALAVEAGYESQADAEERGIQRFDGSVTEVR